MAQAYGEEIDDDDDGDAFDNEEEDLSAEYMEIAMKFVRFFYRTEKDHFALFVEGSIKRHVEVQPVNEGAAVGLTIKMPVPDDTLFAAINFHASTEKIEETSEFFEIPTPRKIQEDSLEFKLWPSKEFPQWLIYKFKFHEETHTNPVVTDIDLSETFAKKVAQQT